MLTTAPTTRRARKNDPGAFLAAQPSFAASVAPLGRGCVLLLAAGFFLWTKHLAHLLGVLPYLFLLLCPLISTSMVGMHNSSLIKTEDQGIARVIARKTA